MISLARLEDSPAEVTGSDYPERWRRFLACVNLYQFCDTFRFWTSSEVARRAPELPLAAVTAVADDWQGVVEQVTGRSAPSLPRGRRLRPSVCRFPRQGLRLGKEQAV